MISQENHKTKEIYNLCAMPWVNATGTWVRFPVVVQSHSSKKYAYRYLLQNMNIRLEGNFTKIRPLYYY